MTEYPGADSNPDAATQSQPPQPAPKISVALAAYNGAGFLRQQLNSLAAQTLLPFELIVTDDGSTDNTAEVVANFAAVAPFPVHYHRNEQRLGFVNNFFRATSFCTGDIIAFCDQDDVWLPTKLIKCAGTFSDPDVLLCVHSSAIWDGAESFSGHWPGFASRSCLAPGEADIFAVWPGFSMVLRRELLQIMDYSKRPTNIHSIKAGNRTPVSRDQRAPVSHDQWAWIMAAVFGKIVQLPDVLAHYRQHTTNTYGASGQSLRRKISRTIGVVIYDEVSELSLEYAQFLLDAAPSLLQERATMARAAAARLEKRADLLAIRARIYGQKSNVVSRLGAWLKLVFVHGYKDDKGSTTLGRNACLKDAVFGVPGVFRLALR